MPLPAPKGPEKEQDFVSRCMADPNMNKDFPKQNQRAGVCYNLYKKAKKRKETKGNREEPAWEDTSLGGGFMLE